MTCSIPPPLTSDQLSAALDDLAEPDVLAHLAGCAHCARRLADARAFERRLSARLYRWDCPSPDELAEYARGRSVSPQSLADHLAGCARCAGELADLRAFLADAAAPNPLPAAAPPRRPIAAPQRIARLLPHQPAAALRGAGDGPLVANAGDVTIFLDFQPRADGLLEAQGQLVADDQAAWEGALAELRQGGALVATAAVDDLGSFQLAALAPGSAELRVTNAAGRMIVVADIGLR